MRVLDQPMLFACFKNTNKTRLERSLAVEVKYGRFSGLIEKIMMVQFRGSVKRTVAGFNEKLEEKFSKSTHGKLGDRARHLKDNLVLKSNC